MPRDGSSTYILPFPDVEEDTTIESAVYNGFTSDVAMDLNAPRPIVAGGTGASNAHDAMIALSGEIAKQLVTNYDSFPFVNGSFYSNPGATGAPEATSGYAGSYYELSSTFAALEARNLTTGANYVRIKNAGVWGAWTTSMAADGAVAKVGDTMTGHLSLAYADPILQLNKTSGATPHASSVAGLTNGATRWFLQLGDGAVESGGNAGSNFSIYRYNDAGAVLGSAALSINRASGAATIGGDLMVAGALNMTNTMTISSAAPIMQMSETDTGNTWFMVVDGSSISWRYNTTASLNFRVTSNALSMTGTIESAPTATTGTYYFGNTGTRYLAHDGTNYVLAGGNLFASNNITASRFESGNGAWLGGGSSNTTITGPGEGNAQLALRDSDDGTQKYIRCNNNVLEFINYAFDSVLTTMNDAGSWSMNGNVNTGGRFTCGPNAVTFSSWLGGPSPYQVNLLQCNPSWGTIDVMALHYSSVWAGVRINGGGNWFDFRLNDSSAHKASGGTGWVIDSDARIKNVKRDYTQGLDAIAALRPIYYTYKRNQSFDPPDLDKKEPLPALAAKARAIEYVGLVAQEAEGAMPELFTREPAYIDGKKVEDMRTAEYTPLIFALVNSVKELKARVEELEAR